MKVEAMRAVLVLLAIGLGGCDQIGADKTKGLNKVSGPEPSAFDPMAASRVADTALSIAGEGSTVLLACGEAVGFSYYADDNGWTEDRVSGESAIVEKPDGTHDVIFSSGSFGFVSARSEGGIVEFMPSPDRRQFSVTTRYPATGVIESQVFKFDDLGSGRGLAVTAKQARAVLPARARTLISNCQLLE